MKIKKIFIFLIIIGISLVFITGCGNSKEDITSNSATITIPQSFEERKNIEQQGAIVLKQYVTARTYLDKLILYDNQSGTFEEYDKLLDDTIKAFEICEKTSNTVQKSAELFETVEKNNYDGTNGDTSYKTGKNKDYFSLISNVYAAEESDAVKWAKKITKSYDSYPVGKGIKELSKQLGTDSKHAYAQLKQAQDILSGNAWSNEADLYDKCYKAATVTKTACEVAVFTSTTILSAGGTMGILEGGGYILEDTNMIVDVATTGSTIIMGENNSIALGANAIAEKLAPVNATLGLFGLGFGNVDDTVDSLGYIVDSINDYKFEGKIL